MIQCWYWSCWVLALSESECFADVSEEHAASTSRVTFWRRQQIIPKRQKQLISRWHQHCNTGSAPTYKTNLKSVLGGKNLLYKCNCEYYKLQSNCNDNSLFPGNDIRELLTGSCDILWCIQSSNQSTGML